MKHEHVESRFDGLHVISIARDIIVIAHPLLLGIASVIVDVAAVVHDVVVVAPAKVIRQADHKLAPGHRRIDIDGITAGSLSCVEGDLIVYSVLRPGYIDIITADSVAHTYSAVGID